MVDQTEAKPISAEALHAVIFHEYCQRTSVRATVEKICESFGPGTVSKSTLERWFQAFMEGRRDFKKLTHANHPSAVDIDNLQAAVEGDPRQTSRCLAEQFHVSHTTIENQLHEDVSKLLT